MSSPPSSLRLFQMLALYNRVANQRLYERCAELDAVEYRRARVVSFGSIHSLLNHMLLADQIWMARFAGGGGTTPPLNTILFEDFPALQRARAAQDETIVQFFEKADEAFFGTKLAYRNSLGKDYEEQVAVAVLHFFNHQTHHRGQVHTLFSQAGKQPPSLDLHRIVNP